MPSGRFVSWLGALHRLPGGGPRNLIVGLGNPGAEHSHTRHNIGFVVCDRLITNSGNWHRVHGAELWKGTIARTSVHVAKPQRYMNASGDPVAHALQASGVRVGQLIVVHDDLDLPFAQIRIRVGGSSGGHRGVQSIIHAVGDDAFIRIKIGIGRPKSGVNPADYVLDRFSVSERIAANETILRAADVVRTVLVQPVHDVMQEVNQLDAASGSRL